MYQDLHFYIDLNWEHYVSDPDNYLQQIYKLVGFVYLHKATVFYNQDQIDEFNKNCTDLDTNFIESSGNLLSLILDDAIVKKNQSFFFEVNFAKENSFLTPVKNGAISSITSHPKLSLISLSEKGETKTILNVRSNFEFEKIQITLCREIESLFGWIIENIPKRKFNLSKKHGQNGAGHQIGASPLLCNSREAQKFLDNAIPDFKKRAKQLYNFDDGRNTFIEFFYEGDNPQGQWHGFHIKKEEWEMRIPENIRNHFRNKLK